MAYSRLGLCTYTVRKPDEIPIPDRMVSAFSHGCLDTRHG